MKRFTTLMLVLLVTMVLVTPAFAAGPQPKGPRGTFALVGTITAIDATAQTVTVQVLRGNTLVKPFIGSAMTLKTTAKTIYRFTDGTTTTAIKFADLKVGDAVSASGTLANGVWTTTRITVGAKLTCLP